MHEQSIAQNIISRAKETGDVVAITVEVGDLGHLPAHEMKAVLEKMTNWKIKMRPKKAKVFCDCGHEGEPKITQQMHDHNIYECTKCGKMYPKILEGNQIILKEVEVEHHSE